MSGYLHKKPTLCNKDLLVPLAKLAVMALCSYYNNFNNF